MLKHQEIILIHNYNYEILTCLYVSRTSGDTNSFVSVKDTSYSCSSADDMLSAKCFGYLSFDGNHAEAGNMSCTIIVGGNRKTYFGIANNSTNKTVYIATKYRRIGENS